MSQFHLHFAHLTWDFPRDIFVIPYLSHPVTWYGLLFALGFLLGYFILRHLFTLQLLNSNISLSEVKGKAHILADKLTFLSVLGTIVGARLGHVFFYDWAYYSKHPLAIVKVWEGGLASHGGAVGILCALVIFTLWQKREKPHFTFLTTLDAVMIPAAFIAGFIRIGNFINQEILGAPTTLPWGIRFLHPAQKAPDLPLHPAQLYEALAYFVTASFLLYVWKRGGKKLGSGLLAGWFFLLVFGARFLIEFVKLPQTVRDESSLLNTGQLLSIPFIIVGIWLIWRGSRK